MMSETEINKLIDAFESRGLMIGPASLMSEALQLQKAKDRIMRRDKMTPYEVAKFKLLPGAPSLETIKNMIKDGRIRKDEAFKDRSNKQYITRACVNRLNGVV